MVLAPYIIEIATAAQADSHKPSPKGEIEPEKPH